MKHTIIGLIIGLFSLASAAQDYQRILDAPGIAAPAIIKAAQMATGSMVKVKQVSGDTLVYAARTYCVKGSGFLAVKIPLNSDVIVEAKDTRYRITFQNAEFAETPIKVLLSEHSADSDTRRICLEGFDRHIEEMHKRIVSYKDF